MNGMKQFDEIKAILGNSETYYLIMVDMNSNYQYINKRYADKFAVIHPNLIGENYAITMHPDDLQICQHVAEKAFNNPHSVFPATIRKHDGFGGYIITRWEYKAMFDENNNPIGIFCIGNDITELIEMSTELNQIKLDQSHNIRLHVANLIGLGQIIQDAKGITDMKNVAKMIIQSASDLDKVIRTNFQDK
jgi:PAS domain S-box-containing protein